MWQTSLTALHDSLVVLRCHEAEVDPVSSCTVGFYTNFSIVCLHKPTPPFLNHWARIRHLS